MQKYDFYYRKIEISNKYKMLMFGGEPLRFGFASLASGYPLHHLRAALRLPYGGSAAIPLASRTSGATPPLAG